METSRVALLPVLRSGDSLLCSDSAGAIGWRTSCVSRGGHFGCDVATRCDTWKVVAASAGASWCTVGRWPVEVNAEGRRLRSAVSKMFSGANTARRRSAACEEEVEAREEAVVLLRCGSGAW